MKEFKILCLGDVVGDGGIALLSGGTLRREAKRLGADFIIVNGENSARGNGMSRDSALSLIEFGADVVTGGNHTFKRREIYELLDESRQLIRPYNYPSAAPGFGYTITERGGVRVLTANLLGTVFSEPLASPFECADSLLEREAGKYDISVFDIHAEATSEKLALARYLDGRATVVFGTHTHIQTADETVLPGGTGYITDLGMTGSTAGVLGVKTESVLQKFTVRTPVFFEAASGGETACGALFTVNAESGLCTAVSRVVFN